MTPQQARRAKQQREYEQVVRPAVVERDGGLCIRCTALGTAPHHIKGKVGKLLTDICYIVLLCYECHQWAHAHPKEARAELLSLIEMKYYHQEENNGH
jgi:hypothetical protein